MVGKCVLSGFFRCDKQPWTPRVRVWSSADVDFANQTPISDSKCYPDLEPTGRTVCQWLTLSLSELTLQIPVAPWGCQNKLNALYTKSWGHFFQPKTFMLLRVSSPSLRLRVTFFVFPEYLFQNETQLRTLGSPLSYILHSLPEGRRTSLFWKFLM